MFTSSSSHVKKDLEKPVSAWQEVLKLYWTDYFGQTLLLKYGNG